ncbi:MAG: MGMT family protein [Saprospiraceae bacterium]|mgnify:CR=1 FL=1|nr:MGMT family protein [Saprospiraceae bacterium]HMW38236.1 MGMT family protein [Saprospiraceae bacterium]HMX87431.1 MGMT family protein [Saprospiraceae bacterium]HMZ39258.1 MGMT family protein [Saprospiraceae bacterium]HNA65301.1 MGMT family protein [Saprospiraceae bacterium]
MAHYYDEVYDIVRSIPKGRVSSYGAISAFLSLGSARMVGWALNQLKGTKHKVPAHRVVNSQGILSGANNFVGSPGMKGLLEKEGVEVRNNRVLNFNEIFWDPSKEII